MLVYQILKSKSDDAVVTVKSGSLVSEAAKILSDRKTVTVVLSQTGQDAKGTLSARDIVRAIANRGASCLMDKVDAYMTAEVVACSRDESADNGLKMMTEGRFRHMTVVESGDMVSLITIGDVVKARLSELAMEKDALEGMIMGH